MKVTKVKVNAGTFLPLLGVVFVILKLTGVVTWSWWFVLAPFIVLGVLAVAVVAFVVLTTVVSKRK